MVGSSGAKDHRRLRHHSHLRVEALKGAASVLRSAVSKMAFPSADLDFADSEVTAARFSFGD